MSMQYTTRGNAYPQGKQRVYFSCHTGDFDEYGMQVMEKIVEQCDCAIWYYGKDENGNFEESKLDDLDQMTLFIFAITKRFLIEENRSYDTDLQYALTNNIPILPIMMEDHLDALFELKIGKKQYLNYYGNDEYGLTFDEKLSTFLETVVIGDKLAQEIREAFHAYIFMSYRKKDRKYAIDLMRLIHKNKDFESIAIWYDEYLTPGENYAEEIEKALDKSDSFVMIVTPNIYEKVNGEYNYVARVEYPAARKRGKIVLPVEMKESDRRELEIAFRELPEVATTEHEEMFFEDLKKSITDFILRENNSTQKYYMGLAYLKGVDVEVDMVRGLSLLNESAEDGNLQAIKRIIDIYENGHGVPVNYDEVLKWRKKLYEYSKRKNGKEHPETLKSLNSLALIYGKVGNHEKELELLENCYELTKRIQGEKYPSTLTSLNNLANSYGKVGNHQKALELHKMCYDQTKLSLGENHPVTIASLTNLAYSYGAIGNHKKALYLSENCYILSKKILEAEHPTTLQILSNMAYSYGMVGAHKKAQEIQEKCYCSMQRILGDKHPRTLRSLSRLAQNYCETGNYIKARNLSEKCYEIRKRTLGDEHPDTIYSLQELKRIMLLQNKD